MKLPKILKYPHPVLAQVAIPVADFNEELRSLFVTMLEVLRKSNGIGLAAPQIGQSKRIIAIDTRKSDHVPFYGVMANPRLLKASGEFQYLEGCLSLPGQKFWITRADEITVQWDSVEGNVLEKNFRGITSICLQHEIDHLNGICLEDRQDAKKI